MDKNELIRLKNELVDRESFQKYINEHKIRSANEFSKHSSTLYKRLNSLGFSREVIYYGNDKPTISVPKRHFIGFDDLESFQSYINENKIESPSDFYKRDKQLYNYYHN